jgi:hypothetical protein
MRGEEWQPADGSAAAVALKENDQAGNDATGGTWHDDATKNQDGATDTTTVCL